MMASMDQNALTHMHNQSVCKVEQKHKIEFSTIFLFDPTSR